METNSNAVVKQSGTLPTIAELYKDEDGSLAQSNVLNVLLNQDPSGKWIKIHPNVPGHKYIPIERVEWLMTRIFIKWKCEVKAIQHIANSVVVTVRVHYLDPVSGEWNYQDGIGASPLQTDKGAGAVDWTHIKNNAVMLAAPSAESYAFKDAVEKIGKLFGKDLNRKDEIGYDSLLTSFASGQTKSELRKKIEVALAKCTDENLKTEVVGSIMEAEGTPIETLDFYKNLLEKLGGAE